jgi:hypothetical protein
MEGRDKPTAIGGRASQVPTPHSCSSAAVREEQDSHQCALIFVPRDPVQIRICHN